MHASASPFEALAERMNWLGATVKDDIFGKAMLDAGIPKKTIDAWSVDPQVTYGPMPLKTSVFDALEDTDADRCLALCTLMAGPKPASPVPLVLAFAVGAAAAVTALKVLRL